LGGEWNAGTLFPKTFSGHHNEAALFFLHGSRPKLLHDFSPEIPAYCEAGESHGTTKPSHGEVTVWQIADPP
jgi:hypothetical protein